jgi:RND family efflux transporter MFP subunit
MSRLVPLTIVLIAGLSLSACGRGTPEEVETEAVVPVTTETATVGTIQAATHVTGVVEPAPGADLLVTAPASARIVEMPKAEGDTVRKGDLLVRFEIPSLAADTASKQAEIDRAQARIQNARSAQARAKDLFDRGVGARKELEDADRELADAQAALAEAKAALSAAATIEGRTSVRATFDGLVAKRSHNPGDLVEPGSSEAVLRVVDPHRLEIEASVPYADVPGISPGTVAHVTVGGGAAETARVISRAAAVDPATGAAPIRLRFDKPTRFAIGTPVQIEIDTEVHKNVVLVPSAAIVRDGDETAVFVAAGDKAARRVVETGVSDGPHVEITKGIKAGDAVIVHGQNGLPDGAKISLEKPGDKSDEKSDDKADDKKSDDKKPDDKKPAAPKPAGGAKDK